MPWIYADSVDGLGLRNVRIRQSAGGDRKLTLDPVIGNVTVLRDQAVR
jgi:hypothetical protein